MDFVCCRFHEIFRGNAVTHRITRLQPDTEYILRVAASSASGQGEWSDDITFVTTPTPPTPPADLVLKQASNEMLQLSWKPVGSTHPVIYEVQYRTANVNQDYQQVRVCIYVCVRVLTCAYGQTCDLLELYMYMHVRTCTCMYVHVPTDMSCMHMHVHMIDVIIIIHILFHTCSVTKVLPTPLSSPFPQAPPLAPPSAPCTRPGFGVAQHAPSTAARSSCGVATALGLSASGRRRQSYPRPLSRGTRNRRVQD